MSLGSDLMNQLNRGELTKKSSEYALTIKNEVTTALVEIISYGARIRPLILEGRQVGWIRPFGFSERKQLDTWFQKEEDRIKHLVHLCTTLDMESIESLDMVELNSILKTMTLGHTADLSLFPYISAFVTTQSSINLWKSRHEELFKPKDIIMPDGKRLHQMTVNDHTPLWATLSSMRDETILRTEAAVNSAIIARSMSGGNSWENYLTSLQKVLNSYSPDNMDTWTNTIDFVSYNAKKADFTDGWAHSHEDVSTEGLLRELQGMMKGDKHEQLIDQFYAQQLKLEEDRQEKLNELIKLRRDRLERENSFENIEVIRTEREVQERERRIKERNYEWVSKENLSMSEQNDNEELSELDKFQRLSKYT